MDARKQPAFAPLIRLGSGLEPASKRKSLSLQARERSSDHTNRKIEKIGKLGFRDRADAFKPTTRNLDKCILGCPVSLGIRVRRGNRRLKRGLRPDGQELRQALSRNPERYVPGLELCCPASSRQSVSPLAPTLAPLDFIIGQKAQPHQRIMQIIGVLWIGPCFRLHARNGIGVEVAEIGGCLRIEPAPRHDGLCAPFLYWSVVEVSIGARGKNFGCKRGGLGQIARDDADGAGLKPSKQLFEPFDIHRVGQAIRYRLIDERMIGYLPLANEVFRAGDLVGEDGRDEVFGSHSGQLRRHFASAAEARQAQERCRQPIASG